MKFLVICRRELHSYFGSFIAYILLAVFLLLSGYFFYSDLIFFVLFGGFTLATGLWQFLFIDMRLVAMLVLPLVTMRLFAEEKKSGTIELLLTYPVRDGEVLLGKYLAALTVFAAMLVLTLAYPLIVAWVTRVEWGPLATGYLGLFLQGAAFIAIGILISSLTENQIVAAVATFGTLLIFWVIAWASDSAGGVLGRVLSHLSLTEHADSFAKGVIETKDLIYYVNLIILALFLTLRSLDSKRWRG